MSAQERVLRSGLALFAHAKPCINATLNVHLVTCGKSGCRYAQGGRHRAVYLVANVKGQKRQVFVSLALGEQVRQWVVNYHAATDLLERDEADVVFCGHAHAPVHEEIETARGTGTYINTGDWIEHRSHTIWDGERFEQFIEGPGIPKG